MRVSKTLVFLIACLYLLPPKSVTADAQKQKGSLPLPKKGTVQGSLELVRKIPFSGYSEGIDFYEGFLWSAVPNKIRKIDPKTGSILGEYDPASRYSESLSWWKSKLWTVSYSDNGIYRGELKQGKLFFERVGTTVEEHAWGLVHDGKSVILTGNHGSNKLYFFDPQTTKLTKTVTAAMKDLEDLAWDGEGLWTSSFTLSAGKIFRLDPKTGSIQGEFELPEPQMCPVVDGIAVEGKNLWVTGKNCPSLYLVKNPFL